MRGWLATRVAPVTAFEASVPALFDRFAMVASARSSERAITDAFGGWTFQELASHAAAAQRFLGAVGPQTVVVVALASGRHLTALQLGALAAQVVYVPVSPRATAREAGRVLDMVRPDLVVVADEDSASPWVGPGFTTTPLRVFGEALPKRIVTRGGLGHRARMVQLTSGSTGDPKLLVFDEKALRAGVEQCRVHVEALRGNTVFLPLSQAHAMGAAATLEHLFHGVGLHVGGRFEPASQLAALHRCSAVMANASWYRLALGFGLFGSRQVRLTDLTLGAEAAEASLLRSLAQAQPGARLHLRYGLAEVFGAVSRCSLAPGEVRRGAANVGLPLPGVQVQQRSTAEGPELGVRAATSAIGVMTAAETRRPIADTDGWVRTGDGGTVDDRGLHLTGRLNTLIKSAGHRISPMEVEATLREHDLVLDAIVVGVPDPVSGQRVVACVQAAAGHSPSVASMRAHCRLHLSAHKAPRIYRVVERLPRTPTGKPDRLQVLALFAAPDL
jgi:acyl-CoA synthetase (AMP-forming)/AMP-acid ligase II